MKQQTILFDLDDTLAHCNKYFDIVIEQFIDLMLTWYSGHELTPADIRAKQLELDLAGVQIHGFMAERFPQSFVETYRWYAERYDRTTSSDEEERLLALGHTVYAFTVEPYPHMSETLHTLQNDGHKLYLYTGGDAGIQMKKVRALGLDAFFQDRIFVTLHKTTEFMETLLHELELERSATWMIGNSLRTDVLPALHAGIHAIHIPAEREWPYNIVDIDVTPRGAFLQLRSLLDVPAAIAGFARKAAL
ncbi:HAD family hydrolase [Paenibacillus athensensis]|uniref:HAD family hydrolase n=2 Tax=Paenibacillus athensensis TaxID=1967502 RepID=A0A4Y8Q5I4_9BACL|nr:HAD family hydrolase [Paenibacillus athensensis]